jgi:hypothetical protein
MKAMATAAAYPLRVEAQLDLGLSRWLWLVKWFLAIPNLIVLAFLWIAHSVLTVVAFFAIIFTGRYPRSIFLASAIAGWRRRQYESIRR